MNYSEKKGQGNWQQENNGIPADALGKIWDMTASYKSSYQPKTDAAWADLNRRLQQEPTAKVVPMARRSFQAAAALVLLLAGVLGVKLYLGHSTSANIVSTAFGETKSIGLPDGTIVRLNEGSEISYPTAFDGQQRSVSMKGEVFFEVMPDPAKPFLVKAPNGTVRVLGTAFNVRSNAENGDLEVVVQSGKVAVQPNGTGDPVTLLKGDRLVYNSKLGTLATNKDEAGIALAWQVGKVTFKNENLATVLNGMERFFHISINSKLRGTERCTQTLAIEKNKLNEAFSVLAALCPSIEFKETAPGQYEVSGSCCE